MNKTELIAKIAEIHGCSKKAAAEMLESVLEAITVGVIEEGSVKLTGFGAFEVTEVAAHQGRNPQTGDVMTIPAKKRMSFRCSKNIKDALNA